MLSVVVCRSINSQATLLGTAFPISPSKLATTAHVVGSSDVGLGVATRSQVGDYQDTTDTQVSIHPVAISHVDPIRDFAVLELLDCSMGAFYELGSADDVQVGSPVFTYGFPHADHGRMVLTEQVTYVGAKVLIGNAPGVKTKQIILNTQARPGQSGGAVLSSDKKRVIAMLVGSYAPGGGGGISLGGVDPHTLHQTTHAISVEYFRGLS